MFRILTLFLFLPVFCFGDETPNFFAACSGHFVEDKDSMILCQRTPNEEQNDELTRDTYKVLRQLDLPEGDNIPSELKQHITKRLENQFAFYKKLSECQDQTHDIDCKNNFQNIRGMAKEHMQGLKFSMALAFNEPPIIYKDALLRRPSLIGGEFPLSGEAIEHPIDDLAEFTADENINEMVNEVILIQLQQNAPYLSTKALEKTDKELSTKEKIELIQLKMQASESIVDNKEMHERDKYINALKKSQQKAKSVYVDILTSFPVLGYLNKENPSDDELREALLKLSENLETIIKDLKNQKEFNINFLHYKDIIEEFLSDRPELCYSVNNSFDRLNFKKEMLDLSIESAMIAANIACPFLFRGIGSRFGCGGFGVISSQMSVNDAYNVKTKLYHNSFMDISAENTTDKFSKLLQKEDEYNFVLWSAAVSVAPAVKAGLSEVLFKYNFINSGAIVAGKGSGFANPEAFERFYQLALKNFKPSLAGKNLLEATKSLSDKAKNKFLKIRQKYSEPKNQLEAPNLSLVTNTSNAAEGETVKSLLAQFPRMQKPIIAAHKKLSDTKAWVDYFETTLGKVFEKMIKTGNATLIAKAEAGIIDEKILLEYLEESFKRRGLSISEIKKGENVLPAYEFTKRIQAGPILDNALGAGDHGAFPHLLQLDFVMDDMMKAGNIERAQEFFDFFATKPGLKVWDQTFDLVYENKTLKSPETVTELFLSPFLAKTN